MSPRLMLALQSGLDLPEFGLISVLGPQSDTDLMVLPQDRVRIVQPQKPVFDHFQALGFDCVTAIEPETAVTILCLPRAKALARSQVYQACVSTTGRVVIDGAKTDGIDSLLRDIRARVPVFGPLSKAHGKVFWFDANAKAFADWQAPSSQMVDGFHTAPGVFSADGIDPGSAMLAANLPAKLGRHVVDLGAGWGYLAASILAIENVKTLDLIEADTTALDCARQNVTDARAQFHWADARIWGAAGKYDTVVMNPPFHTGRSAEPALGRAFIASAARLLAPNGSMWMVANRHLGYESTLSEHFTKSEEIAGDARFKVLRAQRPSRPRR